MKKNEKWMKAGVVMLLSAGVLTLAGCGKEKDEGLKTDLEDLMEDAQETFGGTEDDGGSDDYDRMDAADLEEETEGSWRGDCYRFELEGENGAALNGKITSIHFADDSWVYAATSEGGLYMLWPSIYFSKEESEIKTYKITDNCGISDLVYADQHTAYGDNHFVYFDRMEGFEEEEIEDLYMLESLSDMPDIVYTFENMYKGELSDGQNLLFITQDAALYVYEDTNHQVRAGYKDSYGEEYMMFDEVAFEGDTEWSGVTLEKSVFRFLLTKDQELLYIKNGNIASDLADNVSGVSVSYVDITDQIGAKVTDIYNLLNNTECCYAVDEEQNIYFVSTEDFDGVTAEKITRFENGGIADIQGFAGTNDEMLIRTTEGAYYFCDGDSLYPIRKIDDLDSTYKDAVLLTSGDLLALGSDGYLYVVEDRN